MIVNTEKLQTFANRLSNVNKRVYNLRVRLARLYKNTGLIDINAVNREDVLGAYVNRINKSISYLQDTKYEFEALEGYLYRVNPRCFVAPTSPLYLDRSKDKYDDNRTILERRQAQAVDRIFDSIKNDDTITPRTVTAHNSTLSSTDKERLREQQIKNIIAYAESTIGNPFSDSKLSEYFLEDRNLVLDAVASNIDDIFIESIKQLAIIGANSTIKTNIETSAEEEVRESLIKLLATVSQTTELVSIRNESTELLLEYFKSGSKWNEALEPEKFKKFKKTPEYKTLIEKEEAVDSFSKILKCGQIGLDAAELFLNDYSSTVTYLENMKKTFNALGYSNELVNKSIDRLIDDYTNKFTEFIKDQALDLVEEAVIDESLESTANLFTGGLYGIVEFSRETINEIIGLNTQSDGINTFYSTQQYSDQLQGSYMFYANKIKSGNYSEEDVILCNQMFDLAREAKIQEYEAIKDIINGGLFKSPNEKETVDLIDDEISKLKKMGPTLVSANILGVNGSFGAPDNNETFSLHDGNVAETISSGQPPHTNTNGGFR